MITKRGGWWCLVLLSAAFYDCAFLFPKTLCFLLVPSAIMLFAFFTQNHTPKIFLRACTLWGGIVFSVNLWWLFLVFLRHSVLPLLVCVGLYSFFVVYFVCTVAGWFWVTRMVQKIFVRKFFKIIGCLVCAILYFIIIDFYGLYPLGFGCGYPMANPILPFSHLLSRHDAGFKNRLHISFLTPVLNRERGIGAGWDQDPVVVGFRVFQNIAHVCAKKKKDVPYHVIVGGESYFPFDVSEHPRLINLWRSALGDNDVLLMGCCVKGRQAVLRLRKGRIIDYYVKKWLMPFAECEPSWWITLWGKNVKKGNCALFGGALFTTVCDPSLSFTDTFSIEDFILVPSLCCEFFLFSMKTSGPHDKDSIYIAFVNDSWFDSFFKERLAFLVMLKSWWNKKQILYVSHNACFLNN